MRIWALILSLLVLPVAAFAQADSGTGDRGYLTSLLEQNLSGLGRTVTIDGFAGALSSRATFDRLTIADGDGIWITITGGAISWNRAALLAGRVEIAELSATTIDLSRAPRSAGGTSAEAGSFSLPELPVSVNIGMVKTGRLTLGAAILGAPAVVTIAGSARLEGGEGSTDFSIRRIDGKEGELTLKASFANKDRTAVIDLLAQEGANGIAATLLGLPGKPRAELALHGAGPIDNFTTDMALATGGQPRLTGNLTLSAAPDGRHFSARVQGDIAPVLQPDYRAFFGHRVSLETEGVLRADQRTELTRLVVDTDGLSITGRLGLSAGHVPVAAALTLRFGLPDQAEVLLPLPGTPAYAQNGILRLRYDAGAGQGWSLAGDLSGFRRNGTRLDSLTLDGKGTVVQPGAGTAAAIEGTVSFAATGIALADAAAGAALGPELTGQTAFRWRDGKPLELSGLTANAGDMGLAGNLSLTRDGIDVAVFGALTAKVPDIGRFSGLAGRRLGGDADMRLSGSVNPLSGAFDLQGDAAGRGLTFDQPTLDHVLAQGSRIEASARRDQTGIALRRLTLDVQGMHAEASGVLQSAFQTFTARAAISDLGVVRPGYGGQITVAADLAGAPGARKVTLDGTARGLRTGIAAADPVLAGATAISLDATETAGGFALNRLTLKNPQLVAEAASGADALQISARLADMALIAPGFPGPLTVAGQIGRAAGGYRLTLDGSGPGQTEARISGTALADLSRADVTLAGKGQSALINSLIAPRNIDGPARFDLRLNGPLVLSSLSGKITVDRLRAASPAERISVETGAVTATIANGRALVSGQATLRGGGTLTLAGPVDLAAPHGAALTATLDHTRLRDPNLYDTTVSGRVTVAGPLDGGALIGGALTLHDTEISVASANFDDTPTLPVIHVNEPAPVRDTRARAGLTGAGSAHGNGPVYALDLTLNAPARLFVRGRGLDAELSGAVRLQGTTADAQPAGQFDLRRGRLNLLGKRFVLDQGLVQLLGSFVPYINFSASTDSFGVTSTIAVEGPANAPKLHFTSSSGVPEEEVISQLLFGNGLNNISAFQLAQLANAVATLRGTGGEGLVVRLRKSFKLDDLDITADDQGTAGIKAGKYLTDKLYSESSVASDGTAQIQLNLDVNSNTTLRGTVGSHGTSGAGIFFNKDY